ncbi:MAG: nitronate monooxygenase [Bdellovibrio sp.]|nr:nitronate monooxygenase [Bdellovibrio sp.]
MNLPIIIQGGMGIGVSNWRLARAVSLLGQLGVVSGTGINTVIIRRLQDGDPEGDVRRAIGHFPDQDYAQEVLRLYFLPKGRESGKSYKRCSLPCIDAPLPLQRLGVLASFVEVFLAKENHAGVIGINFLEKLQTSNLSGIYGAMLAGVDYVLMGAGIPREIPGVLDKFAEQKEASLKISVIGAATPSDLRASFDPSLVFPKIMAKSLKRPKFLAIISSDTLALHLVRKATGTVEGFIIEGASAGGHNAPPRGPLQLNQLGEPIYGINDEPNLASFRKIGLPFWLAGTFGSPEKVQQALDLGAAGVQVGTAFAFCNESGVTESLRQAVIDKWCGLEDSNLPAVFTDPLASPTGFPFKVAPLAGTLSEFSSYQARPRKCDIGHLRQPVLTSDGAIVYRCPAEPVADFIHKGGANDETLKRKCLCNALLSNIGAAQIQDDGYEELPLLTAGDDLTHLKQFLSPGKRSYSAQDVLAHLTMKTI